MNNILKCYKDQYDSSEYHCEFTKKCDEYLLHKNPSRPWMSTYLYDLAYELERGFEYQDPLLQKKVTREYILVAFRYPGATRGHIALDKDYIVRDIVFYPDTCFGTDQLDQIYSRRVVDATKEFIGMKIAVELPEK